MMVERFYVNVRNERVRERRHRESVAKRSAIDHFISVCSALLTCTYSLYRLW